MSDSLLGDLMRALDFAGLERMPDSSFIAITPPPDWLTQTFRAAAAGEHITLSEAFPFLDAFLGEAEAFWYGGTQGSIVSGPFAIEAASAELLLRASAVTLGHRRLLVIERLRGDADPRPLLQKARESKLETERLVRKLDAVEGAVKTLSRLVNDLLATDLTDAQRRLADDIGRSATRVQSVASGAQSPQSGPR